MVDHPKSENMETEDLKTDRNSASDTSADTERIRNSQISGQQELNADDTDRNSLKKRQFFIKGSMTGSKYISVDSYKTAKYPQDIQED